MNGIANPDAFSQSRPVSRKLLPQGQQRPSTSKGVGSSAPPAGIAPSIPSAVQYEYVPVQTLTTPPQHAISKTDGVRVASGLEAIQRPPEKPQPVDPIEAKPAAVDLTDPFVRVGIDAEALRRRHRERIQDEWEAVQRRIAIRNARKVKSRGRRPARAVATPTQQTSRQPAKAPEQIQAEAFQQGVLETQQAAQHPRARQWARWRRFNRGPQYAFRYLSQGAIR